MQPKANHASQVQPINVLGQIQHHHLTGRDTQGVFTLIEQFSPAGTGVPMHIHTRETEVFFILSGELRATIGREQYVATAGTSVLLPPHIPHCFEIIQDTHMLIQAYPAGVELMFEELGQLDPAAPDFERVAEICRNHGIEFVGEPEMV